MFAIAQCELKARRVLHGASGLNAVYEPEIGGEMYAQVHLCCAVRTVPWDAPIAFLHTSCRTNAKGFILVPSILLPSRRIARLISLPLQIDLAHDSVHHTDSGVKSAADSSSDLLIYARAGSWADYPHASPLATLYFIRPPSNNPSV